MKPDRVLTGLLDILAPRSSDDDDVEMATTTAIAGAADKPTNAHVSTSPAELQPR